jgi:hypothetical protein
MLAKRGHPTTDKDGILLEEQHVQMGHYVARPQQPAHTPESLNNLIDLYEAWNKPEKVKECRAKLTQIDDLER